MEHWGGFRPGLLKDILRVRVHMPKSAPIAVMTATITPEELTEVKKELGRKKEPILVSEGPIKSHAKICTLRRPSSDVDFLGRTKADGSRQPGILELLRTLVLDKLLSVLRRGPPYDDFPRTMIFFRWQSFQSS